MWIIYCYKCGLYIAKLLVALNSLKIIIIIDIKITIKLKQNKKLTLYNKVKHLSGQHYKTLLYSCLKLFINVFNNTLYNQL